MRRYSIVSYASNYCSFVRDVFNGCQATCLSSGEAVIAPAQFTKSEQMYSGFSKGNGGVIGDISCPQETIDLSEAADTTCAEESLAGVDADGNVIALSAYLLPCSGQVSWQREKYSGYIFERTVCMSQMTSMLHDRQRTNTYEAAIQKCMNNFRSKEDKMPTVLDIGTGTGLLAMQCIRHGADTVIGCEMFSTMASIAEHVVADNNLGENIQIFPDKSTNLDNSIKVDIIVSELLDSALLGECCVPSHADAISRLLSDSQIPISDRVIPHSGNVFATLIESIDVKNMHDVTGIELGGTEPWRSDGSSECRGGWPLIPIHFAELEARGARRLSDSHELMSVSFCTCVAALPENFGNTDLDENAEEFLDPRVYHEITIQATTSGTIHGVALWWTLHLLSPALDPEDQCSYSTAPGASNWQDHWVQVVFPLPQDLECCAGDIFKVCATRDNIHMWLRVEKMTTASDTLAVISPCTSINMENACKKARANPWRENNSHGSENDCDDGDSDHQSWNEGASEDNQSTGGVFDSDACCCGWHMLCGAERLMMLNDRTRSSCLSAGLEHVVDDVFKLLYEHTGIINGLPIILDVSDGSILSMMIARNVQARTSSSNCSHLTADCGSTLTSSVHSKLRIVSQELKSFSYFFHNQLASRNDLSVMMVWNGESWGDIVDYFNDEIDDNEEDREDDPASCSDNVITGSACAEETIDASEIVDKIIDKDCNICITALISECYNYQLSSLPTWAALSFHYQRSAVQHLLLPGAVIFPCCAHVMAAAVHLQDLHVSHGHVGSVNGFDHSALDRVQHNWHNHLFPYKLAEYKKQFLSSPGAIARLDYNNPICDIPIATNSTQLSISLDAGQDHMQCDGIAIWVDYDLHPSTHRLCAFDKDFAFYHKTLLKFFPVPMQVSNNSVVHCSCGFAVGDSDFTFEFIVRDRK